MYQVGNIYFIATIAIIGGGLFGFDISSISAIIATPQYLCYFNQGYVKHDGKAAHGYPTCEGPHSDVQGGITASMPAGSWAGALISGPISDRLGRRKAIVVGSFIWLIGSTICCASQSIPMLVVGRVINGICVGICSAQVPVYIAEVSPPSKRGRLIGAQQWAITWGIMIMFFISYGCSYIKTTAAFRIPWGLQMIPAIILIFGMMILPESPRWLARKDRWDEAHAVLQLVHKNPQFVELEMQDIKEMCEFERRNADVSFLELFKPHMLNRTHIGCFTQIWAQLTGMNVMMYYITYVFKMAGLGNTLLLSSSIQYVINVLMTIPALIWVDRWGRRPTLLVGAALMCAWLLADACILVVHGHWAGPNGVDGTKEASWEVHGAASKAVIACSYLFVASYAPTWGPVSWTYPAELFPLRLRGKANALTTSANWAFNFALSYFVPPAFVNIKWRVYILFAVFCFAMFWHVFFMFPETAGKTLEEVESIFTDPNGIKYLGIPAWKTKVVSSRTAKLERGEIDDEAKISSGGVISEHKELGDSDPESEKAVEAGK